MQLKSLVDMKVKKKKWDFGDVLARVSGSTCPPLGGNSIIKSQKLGNLQDWYLFLTDSSGTVAYRVGDFKSES
jgi:hypothetical protein